MSNEVPKMATKKSTASINGKIMVHRFVCDNCGTVINDNRTRRVHFCPDCGQDMRWDLKIAGGQMYKHPIHSDALAIHPGQRLEHERQFPNIKLDKQNRPVFDNYIDHQAYLDKCNLRKELQKLKRTNSKSNR